MSWEDKIMGYVTRFPGATDRDMREHFNVSNQTINAPCRALVKKGFLIRKENPDREGLLGNYPTDKEWETKPSYQKNTQVGESLQEEDIKHILTDWLMADGWYVKTAWGRMPGVDIDARRGDERWLIEIKGPGSRNPMRNNYFISILGEILQRMNDPEARYTIAFPDMQKYRRLWSELPALAKERTTIDLLLVDANGNIENLK